MRNPASQLACTMLTASSFLRTEAIHANSGQGSTGSQEGNKKKAGRVEPSFWTRSSKRPHADKTAPPTPPTPPPPPSPPHFPHPCPPSRSTPSSRSLRLRWPAAGSDPRCTRCSPRWAWPSASAGFSSSGTSPATRKSG